MNVEHKASLTCSLIKRSKSGGILFFVVGMMNLAQEME